MEENTVTVAGIQGKIKGSSYTLLPDGRTTVCQLTLENGFTVIGTSACVAIENYNKAIGEKYAFEKAADKIWELEGYLLAQRIYETTKGQ